MYYYKIDNWQHCLLGQDLVLGINAGSDGRAGRARDVVVVLVTGALRDHLGLSNVRRYDYADRCTSLSPIRFSNPEEFYELLNGPAKLSGNRKKNFWRSRDMNLGKWSEFEYSRTLFTLYWGGSAETYSVSASWKRARFFTLAFSYFRKSGRENALIDFAYSEFDFNSDTEHPERIRTTRFVAKPTMASPVQTHDPTDLQYVVPAEEIPTKMNEFLSQSSADTPFVLFVYGSEQAKTHLRPNGHPAVIENGLGSLLYPSKRRYEFEDRNRDPRRAAAYQRQRRLSRMPHLYLVDVNQLRIDITDFHTPEHEVAIRKDAVHFGFDIPDPGPKPNLNAAMDSRLLMQVWAAMASGNYWELQRQQRTDERRKAMVGAATPSEPIVAAPSEVAAVAPEGDEEEVDPNDIAPMPEPVRTPPPRDPYDHSSDEEIYEDY